LIKKNKERSKRKKIELDKEGDEKRGKREKHGIFWMVRVWRLDYHLVKSSKLNLAISYEMDSKWGWNHEIDLRVWSEILEKI